MNAAQLRASILQLAVQGRLVEQDLSDEPASVLLDRIRAEKERLIAEGNVKREKTPSRIYRGDDGHFYEQIGDAAPVCIDDELPFDIPESWEWVRLMQIGEIVGGGTPKTEDIKNWQGGDIPWLTPADMKYINGIDVSFGERNITQYGLDHSSAKLMPKGSVIYSSRAPIGYIGIAANPLCTNQGFKSCVPYVIRTNIYIYYCLVFFTPSIQKRASGTTFKEISGAKFGETLIPLPPLAEQHRIVAKIDELMPFVADFDKVERELSVLEKDFPDALKKAILQDAVQGRLVEQDPNDEPASALLARIRAEKDRLIAESKIKKEKTQSRIYRGDDGRFYEQIGNAAPTCIDDELPFEIPETWEWVRLGQGVYNRGQIKPSEEFSYIDIGSIDNINQSLNEEEKIVSADKAPSRARKIVEAGDIIYSTVRPYLHNMCIINKTFSRLPIASTGFAVMACYADLLNKYLFFYLLSPEFDSYANDTENARGVAYPAISDEKLYKAFIPLPPLAEQHRIVAKIDELMGMMEEMKG